jgi:hypothetical protein
MAAQGNKNSGFPLKRLTVILAAVWIALSFPLRLPPASWLQQSMHGAPQAGEAESATTPFPDKPPFFFGRRSLTDVCREYGIDEASISRELGGFAITARPEWSIKRIAEENDMEQEALFEVIRELSIDRVQPSDMID